MKGLDLFLAVNDVNDSYIEEAAGDVGMVQSRSRICKIVIALVAVLFVAFVGNEVLFFHGELRYKVVKVSSIFQPQDQIQVGRKPQVWEELPLYKRYPKLCMDGVVYEALNEDCDEKKLGQFLGTYSVVGTEYVRAGVLLYFDMEILHETEVHVYKIIGKDPKNAVAVGFEKNGKYYVYDRTYK